MNIVQKDVSPFLAAFMWPI